MSPAWTRDLDEAGVVRLAELLPPPDGPRAVVRPFRLVH